MQNTPSEGQLTLIAVSSALSSWAGWIGWLFALYAATMALDFITGTSLALKQHCWDSQKAYAGLWKKFGSMIAVGVAALVDALIALLIQTMPNGSIEFSYTAILCPVVIAWYTVTELGSIAENAGKMGAPLPSFLRNGLEVLNSTIEAAGENSIDNDP